MTALNEADLRASGDFRLSINGFWLLTKRLEEDCFVWSREVDVPTFTVEQLHWLFESIDIGVVQRHPRRVYERCG